MQRPEALVVDHAVAADLLGLVDEVRAAGLPVVLAVAGDGTDPGSSDLAARFDAVVDAAAKPTPAFFAAACTAVAAPPARTLFVGDVDRNVRGARAAGRPEGAPLRRRNGPAPPARRAPPGAGVAGGGMVGRPPPFLPG